MSKLIFEYHFIYKILLFSVFLSACNGPTVTSTSKVANVATKNYDKLGCDQLNDEIKRLNLVIQELSPAINEPRYVLHTETLFVGTGDNMGTVALIRSKAEKDAVQKAYISKACQTEQ